MSKEAALNMITPQAPVTTPPVQGTNEPVAAPSAPQQSDAARLASFARREAELVKRDQQAKLERQEWMKDKTRADEILKKADQFETTRKTDPVAALKMLGLNETEIFNWLASQEKKELTPEERAAEAAAKAAQEKIDGYEKTRQDEITKANLERDTKLLDGFKKGMGSFIDTNKEKLPFCSHYGPAAVAQAYQNVLQTVKDSNGQDVPTISEAIQEMEELYEFQYQEMNKLKTPKTEAAPQPEKTTDRTRTVNTPPGHEPPKSPVQRTRTSGGTPTTQAANSQRRLESRDQKRERLMNALRNGKL